MVGLYSSNTHVVRRVLDAHNLLELKFSYLLNAGTLLSLVNLMTNTFYTRTDIYLHRLICTKGGYKKREIQVGDT